MHIPLRQQFLFVIQENSTDKFLALTSDKDKHTDCEKILALGEAVKELNRAQLDTIWERLCEWIAEQYLNIPLNTSEGEENKKPSVEHQKALKIMKVIIRLVTLTTKNLPKSDFPEELTHVVKILNSILPELPTSEWGLRSSIVRMCKLWWIKGFPDRDMIAMHTFTYLLDESLKDSCRQADVKHVWDMRECLDPIFVLNNSNPLRLKLLKVAQNDRYLNQDKEGRKLIAYLFNLGPDFIDALHKAIKQRIPYCSVKEAEAYGEIYLRAWRTVTKHQDLIAEKCLQDLMFHAIHARRQTTLLKPDFPQEKPVPMATLLFVLLHVMHQQKEHSATGEMLYQLYQPLLFRAVKVANAVVRANAARIFFDIFPLQAPGELPDKEQSLNNQFEMIKLLLRDQVPLVRISALEGLCQMLAEKSHTLPAEYLPKYLKLLTSSMIFDASSSDVRVAVIEGLLVMLQNPMNHPLLNIILPRCSVVLHDVSEQVRAAFVDLLIEVRARKTLELFDIVSLKNITAQLVNEKCSSVPKKLVKLLYPYVHPDIDKPMQGDNFNKFMYFVEEYRAASRAFYRNSRKEISWKDAYKFVALLIKFVTNYAVGHRKAGQESDRKRSRKQPAEEEGDEEQGKDVDNDDSESEKGNGGTESDFPVASEENLLGIFDVMCILLTMHMDVLCKPAYSKYLDVLRIRFQKKLPIIQSFYKHRECVRSFLYLASLLLNYSSTTLPSMMTNKLKSLPENATEEQYCYILDILCNWHRADDVLEIVTEWITAELDKSNQANATAAKNRRPGRRVQFNLNGDDQPKPLLAFAFLSYLLKNPNTKRQLLKKFVKQSLELRNKLASVLDLIEKRISGNVLTPLDASLTRAFSAYLRLAAVLNLDLFSKELKAKSNLDENDELAMNTSEQFLNIFAWAERSLLPCLGQVQENTSKKRPWRKSRRCSSPEAELNCLSLVSELLAVADSLIIVHGVNKPFGVGVGELILRCLQQCEAPVLLGSAMQIACNLQLFFLNQDPPELTDEVPHFNRETLAEPIVEQIVACVLTVWSRKASMTTDMIVYHTDLNLFKLLLKNILLCYCRGDIFTPVKGLLDKILISIITGTRASLIGEIKKDVPEKLDALPALVASLLSALSNKIVGDFFLTHLNLAIQQLDLTQLVSVLHILFPLCKETKTFSLGSLQNCVKSAQTLVENLGQELASRTNDQAEDESHFSDDMEILELASGIIEDLKKKLQL